MKTAKALWRWAALGVVAVPALLASGPVAHAALSYNHNDTVLC